MQTLDGHGRCGLAWIEAEVAQRRQHGRGDVHRWPFLGRKCRVVDLRERLGSGATLGLPGVWVDLGFLRRVLGGNEIAEVIASGVRAGALVLVPARWLGAVARRCGRARRR